MRRSALFETRDTKRTPLHLASACGLRVDIILELIRSKADKRLKDALNKLPLDYAKMYSKFEAWRAWDLPSKPSAVAIRYAIHYEVSHQMLTFCKIPHDGGSPIDRYEFAISRCDDGRGTIDTTEFEPWRVQDEVVVASSSTRVVARVGKRKKKKKQRRVNLWQPEVKLLQELHILLL